MAWFWPLLVALHAATPSPNMKTSSAAQHRYSSLANEAHALYTKSFPSDQQELSITVAPGRVNLIGEHTDYTGGFVLPFAIDYATVVVGSGSVKKNEGADSSTGAKASLAFASAQSSSSTTTQNDAVHSADITSHSKPSENGGWTNYVIGTVYQYLCDLPPDTHLTLQFALSGDVPLGSGLSSSAALEVSVARFVETVLQEYAFSSSLSKQDLDNKNPIQVETMMAKVRAMRCQKAENDWCNSPCGIMDQYVSSAAKSGSLLLIDCNSLEAKEVKMASTADDSSPVIVVANSNVQHDIAGGEYPIRVQQCQTATKGLQSHRSAISKLRHATLDDVNQAKQNGLLDDLHYRRAKHVVGENQRVIEAQVALESGDWNEVGRLMNESHKSMKEDYEVSCKEIDVLVDLACKHPGVYGSRLTGGGFGGCTVSLVDSNHATGLMEHLRTEYKKATDKECFCFETKPVKGADVLDNSILLEK